MAWFLTGVGHGLRESAYMLWETLWALIVGFALSGAIQAFSSRAAMQSRLGDHRPPAIARATLYGTISSSCSYAASALARSIFAKGGDFVSAMVFMFASTNLVIELGVVLAVLLGWPFLAAEFTGGAIMIILLAAAGSLSFGGRVLADARARQEDRRPVDQPSAASAGRGRWADAAGYAVADLTMLGKEMAVGFTAAGFLATLVPSRVWNDFFVHGHGFWTSAENVAVGPLVAIISFVCSVGNVPLAAALWKGGISFGGVISFVFADLITLPLLLVYRKQYGAGMARRMLAVFWLVMSLAGVATEYLFRALGALPHSHPALATDDSFRWDHTTWLDLAALVLLAGIIWLHRQRDGSGAGSRFAIDPVCGMQVEMSLAPVTMEHEGRSFYFCSELCQHRFASFSTAPGH